MKAYKGFISVTKDFQPQLSVGFIYANSGGVLDARYKCRKCGHEAAVKGRTWYFRKCQRCHHDESCTAGTLFHKLKSPLVKVFWIIYQLSKMKKSMSTLEISRHYGIHQETAWCFKHKVQMAMQQSADLLNVSFEVDETLIGGSEEGALGVSYSTKKIVQIALEAEYPDKTDYRKSIIKRGRARVLKDYTSKELGRAIDEMVHADAAITTDRLPAYRKTAGARSHQAYLSEFGRDFPELH